uniref:RING-type domain-containing protein n=1 Tax=Arundo donax TaxID=35708 RepID=A0A0A9E3W8_ARUDO
MNSDHILEVPDTPDQIQQSTCPVSSSVAWKDIAMAAANPFPRRRCIFKTGNSSMHSPSSQGNASSVPAPSDADIFKQADMARVLKLSEDLESKLSSQSFNRTTGTSSENEMRAEKHGLDQSISTLNHISCSDTGERSLSCQVRDVEVSLQDANHRSANFLGVGSGLPTIPVGKPRNRTGISTINRLKVVAGADVYPASSSGEVKGEAITNKAVAGPSSPPCVVPQRHVGQKKLVRNGCISPSNIAKKGGVLHHLHPQLDVSGKGNVIDLTDNSPITTRQESTVNDRLISANNMETRATKRLRTDRAGKTSIPLSECHTNSSNNSGVSLSGRNNKGKEICYDFLDSMRIGEGDTRRVCPSAGGFSSVVNNSSSSMNPEQGWRTTHNHTSKLPISSMGSRQESGSSAPSDQDHGSAAGGNKNLISDATTTQPESLGNKTLGIVRGRRKPASSSSHPGESSHALNEPRGSFLASSRTTAGRNRTTRQHDIPVITIDDVFPETRPSSSGYNNRTLVDPTIQAQLEADELLARQLQEQLYNESPRVVPTEEIDAVIAMSLQHEEDAHRSSRAARRSQYNTRGAQAPRSQASRSNAYQSAAERRNTLISRLQNAASITLGLGAVYPRYPGGPHIQPNIDLNDYDALLALDENNHQHTGASESQINNLPQSVVQSNSIEEPCAVCLESPSLGDTIRHLPCFHKFHKECIDEWLRRKKLCPICKSGIR